MKKEINKKLIEERSRHEAEWGAVMDSSADAIYILDPARLIIRANKAFYNMTASTPDKAIGRHITDIVHPHGELEPCPVCRAQEAKKDAVIIMEADDPDNPAGVPLEIVVKVVRDKSGNALSIFMSLHDLTAGRKLVEEKRILEEQLRQAQKMESIGRLAGGIAHDFNNILTTILGYSELVLMEMADNAPFREEIEIIRSAGEKAAGLTRQLLAFSRKQVMDKRPVAINKIIQDISKLLSKLIGEDIIITTIIEAARSVVVADQGQIEQVLMNLVVNARDAMPCGGRLIIETQNVIFDQAYAKEHPEVKAGDYIMMAVTDFGEGMNSDVIEYIFDPFFTTKEQGKGTGLGLSTVYGIIKQHNGHIYAYSEIGKGTTFKIYFPASSQIVVEPAAEKGAGLSVGTETILIVDDEPSIRSLIIDTLEPFGYTCLEASCGADALQLIQTRPENIDLLLTDVIMPGMNGKELSNKVSKDNPAIKTVFISGYTENSIAHHGILDPGINYIQKPLTPTILIKKLRQVLDARRGTPCGGPE